MRNEPLHALAISNDEKRRRSRLLFGIIIGLGVWLIIMALGACIFRGEFGWKKPVITLIPGTAWIVFWLFLLRRRKT